MKSKYLQTQIQKHGSYEAYREFMREIGSKGGKNSKGFSPEASKKGGQLGRRGWSYKGIQNNKHVWVHNESGKIDTKPVDKRLTNNNRSV